MQQMFRFFYHSKSLGLKMGTRQTVWYNLFVTQKRKFILVAIKIQVPCHLKITRDILCVCQSRKTCFWSLKLGKYFKLGIQELKSSCITGG